MKNKPKREGKGKKCVLFFFRFDCCCPSLCMKKKKKKGLSAPFLSLSLFPHTHFTSLSHHKPARIHLVVLVVLLLVVVVVGGRVVVGVSSRVGVDVTSCGSVVSSSRRVRIGVLLMLLLVVLLLVVLLRVRVPGVTCVRVVVLLMVLLRMRVAVVLLLLLRVRVVSVSRPLVVMMVRLRRSQAGPGGLPVRQRRVHEVVDRLEQVLDAVRRRHAGVAQVRDQLRGDVVHGDVGDGLAALGRGERAGHLVLEEAGEGGGQGPVALRVGDALVLLFFVRLLVWWWWWCFCGWVGKLVFLSFFGFIQKNGYKEYLKKHFSIFL